MRTWLLLTIIAILVPLASLGATPSQPVPAGLQQALAAQERHTDALLATAGVVGTALGLDDNGDAVVQVFVTHPGVRGIPGTLDSVAVQVKVTGAFEARADEDTVYPTPVPIGVSSSNVNSIRFPFCSTGTLGARLVDADDTGYGLSNNHVYANTNGSNGAGPGSGIIQPGLADSGCSTNGTNQIGTLYAYVPIDFNGGDNLVDAAIAIDGNQASPLIGTATPGDGYGEPNVQALLCENDACGNLLGVAAQKRGRTTHLTKGTITGVNVTVIVDYSRGNKARFVDQLIVEPGTFSAGGDSGSLVVTDNEAANPVGLLFAGSSSTTIINRIDLVFSELATNVVGTPALGLGVDGQTSEPMTDVAVTAVSAPSSVVQGEVVSVDVTVENVGNQHVTTDIAVTLTDETDAAVIGTQTISGGLAVGVSTTLTYSWDTGTASMGDHTLVGSHDLTDDDATNNSKSAVVAVEQAITDLAVTSVSAPPSVTQGDVVRVDVTVENVGNQDVGSDINVTLSDDTAATEIGTQTISGGLTAGASVTLSFLWDTTGAATGDHTLTGSQDFADDDTANDSRSTVVAVTEPAAGVEVTAIDPNSMQAGTTVDVTITGSGFAAGAQVTLENGDGPAPTVSGVVVVDANTITATMTARSGGPPRNRVWDVRVTNADASSGVLVDGFTITP